MVYGDGRIPIGELVTNCRAILFDIAENYHGWKTLAIHGIDIQQKDIKIKLLFESKHEVLDF
jgi:hypothetical protein